MRRSRQNQDQELRFAQGTPQQNETHSEVIPIFPGFNTGKMHKSPKKSPQKNPDRAPVTLMMAASAVGSWKSRKVSSKNCLVVAFPLIAKKREHLSLNAQVLLPGIPHILNLESTNDLRSQEQVILI